MLERGLEPPPPKGPAPKAGVSTISPLQRCGGSIPEKRNSSTSWVLLFLTCPPTWTRTKDQSLKRRVLYQLSYRRIEEVYRNCWINSIHIINARSVSFQVPRAGLEPAWHYCQGCLRPSCLTNFTTPASISHITPSVRRFQIMV